MVRKGYEGKIDTLNTEKVCLTAEITNFKDDFMPLDAAFDKVAGFLRSPAEIWENGDIFQKRMVQDLCFSGDVFYDKESKFRTTDLSPIFKVFNDENGENKGLVGVDRFEPSQSMTTDLQSAPALRLRRTPLEKFWPVLGQSPYAKATGDTPSP